MVSKVDFGNEDDQIQNKLHDSVVDWQVTVLRSHIEISHKDHSEINIQSWEKGGNNYAPKE